MQRRGRRIVGITVVIATAVATYALGDIAVTDQNAMTRQVPTNGCAALVVSTRNRGPGNITITGVDTSPDPSCIPFSVGSVDPSRPIPLTLAPGEQQQFLVNVGASPSPLTCNYTVNTSAGPTAGSLSVQVVPTGATIDVEPQNIDFGTHLPLDPETQLVNLYNYSGADQPQPL